MVTLLKKKKKTSYISFWSVYTCTGSNLHFEIQ